MIRNSTALLTTTTLLAAAIMSASVQAATPASLQTRTFGGSSSAAVFAGGATINEGVNFLTAIPSGQRAGIMATITPAAADVGQEADMYMVINAGDTWYMQTATGFEVWDTKVANLKSYATKTLGAAEKISMTDLEAAAGKVFDGKTLRVHVGYMTSTSPLIYSSAIQAGMTSAPGTTCPTTSGSSIPGPGSKRVCPIDGQILGKDLHLTNNFDYVITGKVEIGGDNVNQSTLTIDAGVKLYGAKGADWLQINRGSKIHVNGTKANPVIMTAATEADADTSSRSLWGGLVINGNATINPCAIDRTTVCEATGEADTGMYGGNDDNDSSGNLNYLQVLYAGNPIDSENELNGIAFQGVGAGTLVDYVQVYNSSDDGIEMFGGTVNAKHLYLVGNSDDSLDWTEGWRGKVQHVVIIQTDEGDTSIEADNKEKCHLCTPMSEPTIANLTAYSPALGKGKINLRRGTGVHLSNAILIADHGGCLDIDDPETQGNFNTKLTITNTLLECPALYQGSVGGTAVKSFFEAGTGNQAFLNAAGVTTNMTNYINSAFANAVGSATQTDSFFDNTTYIGAVKDVASDWTAGWTFKPGN